MTRRRIALVDDDPHIVMLLDDLFGEEGYRTLAIRRAPTQTQPLRASGPISSSSTSG